VNPRTSSPVSSTPASAEAFALLATVLGNAAAAVTYAALPVALTAYGTALDVAAVEEVWIPDSFLLAVVCVTPLTSWLIATWGARRLLYAALAGVALSTAVTALSSSFTLILALLFVQGLFAAPVPPATQALVAVAVPSSRRSVAMGLWSAGTMLGTLVGAALGGVVVQHFGWRWIFALAVPFALAALPAAWAALRPAASLLADTGAPVLPDDRHPATDWRGLILLVAALLSAGVATDVFAEFDRRWLPAIGALAALALASAAGFAFHYRRVRRPVLDLSTLRDRRLALAATMNAVVAGSSTGIFETLMLSSVLGFSPELLGEINAYRGAALMVGIVVGALVASRGHHAKGAVAGLVVLCAGKVGYTFWNLQTSVLGATWPGVVTSIGYGMLATVLAVMAFDTIDRRRSAAAASVFVFGGVVGSALGVALLDAFRAWRDLGGAGGAELLSSYRAVFWIELLVTVLLIPLALAGSRANGTGKNGGSE